MKERKMWIDKLHIEDYRAFQKPFNINLSKNLTVIAGMNGVGKSTILAILTNVGELPTKYKTISGSQFRGEFSDVIMYDKEHDTPGDKVKIHFADLPDDPQDYNVLETLQFRATKQMGQHRKYIYHKLKGNNGYERTLKTAIYPRYRLIPKKTKEHNTEKKILWPSLYLGLSRLAPLGEYDTATKKDISEKISKEIIDAHAEILSENLNDENTKMANLDIGIKHQKSEIKTENYGFESNSSGQDNTGQIIESVLSFEVLKEKLGDEYIGGILAVDEIDATLHPAAQNRLIDWLLRKSEELDLQIVFTTHSLTLLEHLTNLEIVKPESILVNYLISSQLEPGFVRVKENPNKLYYRHNLEQTYDKLPVDSLKIKILSEDKVTRWFFKRILELNSDLNISEFKLLDISISWSHLLELFDADPINYEQYILILDPDMNPDVGDSPLAKYIKKHEYMVSFKVNSEDSNVMTLPGSMSIEKELWNYVNDLQFDHSIFRDDFLGNHGITSPDNIKEMCSQYEGDKYKYKHWFTDNFMYMNIFSKYWIKDNSNDVQHFVGILKSICNRINKQN